MTNLFSAAYQYMGQGSSLYYIITTLMSTIFIKLSQGHIQNSLKPVQFLVSELRLQFKLVVFFCSMSQVLS